MNISQIIPEDFSSKPNISMWYVFSGELELEARSTPGHTDGCMTYVLHSHKMCFTGKERVSYLQKIKFQLNHGFGSITTGI